MKTVRSLGGRRTARAATRLLSLAAIASMLVLAGAMPVHAEGDGSVGSDPGSGTGDVSAQNDIASFRTIFNTDVVYAGQGGMRGGGNGSIALSGVTGPVSHAFLYWHGPTNSADPSANAAVTFAGQGVNGTQIGFSDNNCWGFQNSQGYRADVTSLVGGDGAYALANFVKAGGIDVNGVELIVFFNDGNPANNRDVVLFDGNDSNIPNAFDAPGWNVSLAGINYTSGSAAMEMIVSDGQTFPDDAVVVNSTTIAPTGGIFDGATVPNVGGAPTDGLWDNRPFDVTSLLTPGPNTLTLTTGLASDCLSLIVAAVDLPAGSAPGQPATIQVTKTIGGTAPEGSTFHVDVVCTPSTGGPAESSSVTFDAEGNPTSANGGSVEVPPLSTCEVTEAAPAEAPSLVSYACAPGPGLPDATCATSETSATVTVDRGALGVQATVDVLNLYAASLQPRFTG